MCFYVKICIYLKVRALVINNLRKKEECNKFDITQVIYNNKKYINKKERERHLPGYYQ